MKTERLKKIVSNFSSKRIAVLGDLILDSYIWGKTERISQEAPVPVVQVKERTYSLGGASNVMRNVGALGASCHAFGILGDDLSGARVIELLAKSSVSTECIIRNPEISTIEKQRVIASNQQLLRIDYEKPEEVKDKFRQRLLSKLERISGQLDCIIIEDYAKGLMNSGFANEIVKIAEKNGIPAGLDPHPSHDLAVEGIEFATPNRKEALAISGVKDCGASADLRQVACKLISKWKTNHLLITLGADGMELFDSKARSTHIPTRAREVFDVTGAGDTVIAIFALAMVSGASPVEAAQLANHAAGIVVARIGTSFVTPDELVSSFENPQE